MPKIYRFFESGFIDVLSLIAVIFLVASIAAGTIAVTNKNSNQDIREKAAGACGTRNTGCLYYDCSQKIDCSSGALALGFCSTGYTCPGPCPASKTGCGSGSTPKPTSTPTCSGEGGSCVDPYYCCAGYDCNSQNICHGAPIPPTAPPTTAPTPAPTSTPITGICCANDPTNLSQVNTCTGLSDKRCRDFTYCSFLSSCPTPAPTPTPIPGVCCANDPLNRYQVNTCTGLSNSNCHIYSSDCFWNPSNNCSQTSTPSPTPSKSPTPKPTSTPTPTLRPTSTPIPTPTRTPSSRPRT